MRYLAIPEVIHTELLYKAKNIAVNIILALVLMLRMSTFAASLNFFDHYWGIAIFSFFAANFNTEDNDGATPLHHAAKNGHSDVCLELIEAGAATEATDSGDWTPLIWVSTYVM